MIDSELYQVEKSAREAAEAKLRVVKHELDGAKASLTRMSEELDQAKEALVAEHRRNCAISQSGFDRGRDFERRDLDSRVRKITEAFAEQFASQFAVLRESDLALIQNLTERVENLNMVVRAARSFLKAETAASKAALAMFVKDLGEE